jgi:hypothetical protein
VNEVVRDAAAAGEMVLQCKLERGRLRREEVLLREKVRMAFCVCGKYIHVSV